MPQDDVPPQPGPPSGPLAGALDRAAVWSRGNVLLVDGVGAVLFTLACARLGAGLGLGGWLSVLVTFALGLPLALRRVRPVEAGILMATAAVAQLLLSDTVLPADLAVPAVVYALAAYAPRWASIGGLVLGLAGAGVLGLRYFADTLQGLVGVTLVAAVTVLAAWALGSFQRVRLQNADQLAERARLLAAERENEARLAVTGERQRIAREVHDVVAHSLSVIVSQADGGRYAARRDPASGVAVLETIAATGRQALTDMRSLLGVLRDGPGDERAPQPDVARIPELVREVRASGLDVVVRVDGVPRPLPAAVQLAAYRIVQESLTNVLKHAGPAARAGVRVRWDGDALRLEVEDDGRGAAALVPPAPGGQGLLGMSERARLHGGSVSAAPRPGGGFAVRATLPHPR